MSKIHIYRDNVWAGTGTIDASGCIVDCPAMLGIDDDASEQTYEEIEGALDREDTQIVRPDGMYTWVIDDA